MSEPQKLSPVETIKSESNYLRGNIVAEMKDGNDFFSKGSTNLLKFHGTYQQDDREARTKRDGQKSTKEYIFMVRLKLPGGKLNSEQLLAQFDMCDELSNGGLRITTRQGIQFHGVPKRNLWETIHRINKMQLSTLAACGDVERNVMCCPAPHYHDPVHNELQALADRLASHFAPRTRAYHEIWVRDPDTDEEQLVAGGPNGHEVEPIYGPSYLPRKFKTAIGLAGDNCVDLYANDLGLMAVCEDYRIVGYNVLVGGSFGMTPSAAKTFPAVAKRMTFITPEQVVDVATSIVKVQRDFGDRADRKHARMKYLIHDWGLDRFKAKVEEYYGHPLPDPHPEDIWGFDDHMGWHEQGDGRWFYGLNVENGRIVDREGFMAKTAFREICRRIKPGIRLTSHQSILFTDVDEADRATLETILRDHGVPLTEQFSNVRRWSMACVAWPTCGLAITESERVLPGVIDHLEAEVAKLGLAREVFTVRMTGCPNGCARPYNCDVGLVGRSQDKYTVYLGGRVLGDRLNTKYKDMVPLDEITPTLVPLLTYFKHAREPGERFGDFCHRKGVEDLAAWADQFAAQTAAA
jgi:sulfite reductase (ferredoxin)